MPVGLVLILLVLAAAAYRMGDVLPFLGGAAIAVAVIVFVAPHAHGLGG